MSKITASELRESAEDLGAELSDGRTTGFIEVDGELNLNAMAIGLGLENIQYEPEKFPGLIYNLERPDTTLMLFGDGIITCINGSDEAEVSHAISEVLVRLDDLGLHEVKTDVEDQVTISDQIPKTEYFSDYE